MMPGLGVDPAKLLEMQKVTKHITAELELDYKGRTLTVSMSSGVREADDLIMELLEQFTNSFGQQLNSFFAITGKIIRVNRGK